MAKHQVLSMIFLLLSLVSIPPTTPLQPSQSWTLLMFRRILHNPPVLQQWNNSTSPCSMEPSPSLTIACYEGSITQLHISGELGSPPLSRRFNITSLFTALTRLPDLKVLSLTSLGLWGTLPPRISRLAKLEILDLSSNYLSGPIPREASALKNLQSLILDHNGVSGHLPGWLGDLPRLAVLSLRNNSLSGSIPDSIQAAESLRIIRLAVNNLSGEVPDLRHLLNLQVLDLEDNAFASQFPAVRRKVVTVLLGRNKFTGALPSEIGSYYMLQQLDVSSNRFVGPFPAAPVLALPLLRRLDISGNMFTGMLFQNMSCGDSLEFVDLSENLLTGSLPECLITRNASYKMNCLSTGSDAQHQLAYCQNEALAVGFMLHTQQKKHKSNAALVSSVVGGVLFGVMVIGVVFVVIAKRGGKKNPKQKRTRRLVEHALKDHPANFLSDARYASQTMKLGAFGIAPYRVFSLEELEAATNNFDTSSFMGEGSYGQMYRGKMQDGSLVAIRCLKLKKKHTAQSLSRHIELIGKLRHRHLVSALGHCLEYYFEDSSVSRVFLAFEYIPNGTLRSRICEGIAGQKLTWTQRIAAAIGVAKGIQFLHIGVVPGLFGNNIKTTNVLLDQNLVAKISGYNLPVLADDINTKLTTSNSSSGVKEVNKRVNPDDKIDIYDFGVILLEMITGKPLLTENVDTLIDQLHSVLAADGAVRKKLVDTAVTRACSDESLRTVTEICIRCLSKDPASRPSIDDVLWNLQFAIQAQDTSRGESQSSDGSISPYQHRPQVIHIK